MLTIKEAEEILKKEYHKDNFLYVVDDILLPDFKHDFHAVSHKTNLFANVTQLGYSTQCDLAVFEILLNDGVQNRRVTITQEAFRMLRGLGINNAIIAFVNADSRNYRFSLLTSQYEFDGTQITRVISNPRRYSYNLGFDTKTKTAYTFLISKGKVKDLEELKQRFSVEVVNKHFYSEVAHCFTRLVGGKRDGVEYKPELHLYGVSLEEKHNKYVEFAVRLIGRIIFCWFLKQKKSNNGIPLIPEKILSETGVADVKNYYHDTLEPLFFEILNKRQGSRRGKYGQEEFYIQIPYLNGGLFSPHVDDQYKFSTMLQAGQYGLVNINNEWFKDFYHILSEYNFTVDENTSYDIELSIDPEMLGRIFENLLAEISSETADNAKKNTGSFYTPRDIVDYMVDSSLLEYLKNKTNIDDARLKALISYNKEDDELCNFNKTEKQSIVNALFSITILDPACGSGAFPIGMLQKIVYMLQEVDPSAELWFDRVLENVNYVARREFEKKFNAGSLDYVRKLLVIQNSIFGVDIQPLAVEIARLRCFLSLVIEETVDDNELNRNVNPLPNLDFKFIVANTLLDLPKDDEKVQRQGQQMSFFENADYVSELKRVREEYFSANDTESKLAIREEFISIQKRMLEETIHTFSKLSSKRYNLLSTWNPFSNDLTNWFDAEWMFGIKEGFDIVIANPPYIQLQKAISGEKKLGDLYEKCNYTTFAKTGDIYCLFYERGYNLLKNNGLLVYITSNKWMRAGYGEKLRGFLTKNTNPLLLVDFAGQKVFDSATVDVNILMFAKAANAGQTHACCISEKCKNNLSVYVEQNFTFTLFDSSDTWTILSPIEQSIKHKIESAGVPLKEWDIQINYGIKTGLNEAFIISSEKRAELIAADPKSAEIIRPILRGRDIKRYGYNFADLWIIASHNGNKDKNIPPINIEEYPAIKEHLDKFYPKLSLRTDKGDTPYNLRNCVYMDDFNKPKIIYPNMTKFLPFFYDDESFMTNQKCFIITGETLAYLTVFLNSSLFKYCFRESFPELLGGTRELSKIFFDKIPVLKVSKQIDDEFMIKLKSIQEKKKNNEDTKLLEMSMDEMIFDLYKLTAEERGVIGFIEIE